MRTSKSNLKKVNDLVDLLFPVEIIKQTNFDCLTDCEFEVFVYPFKKEIETPFETVLEISESNENVTDCTELVLYDNNTDIVIPEQFDVTLQTDFTKKLRVNVCSSQYKLIPNSSIFPQIEQILLQSGIEYSVTYSMLNYSRFYVEYVIEDKRFAYNVGNGDFVKPVVKVSHSYNGATNYKIIVGWFRLVCSNGLVIAIEDMKDYNLCIVGKHTEKIESSLHRFEQLLNIFTVGNPVLNVLFAKIELLNSVQIFDLNKAIETTLEKCGITSVDNKVLNTLNYITNRIGDEQKKLNVQNTTNWLLYNAINHYINNDSLNKTAPELRTDKDQKVFEYLLNVSRTEINKQTSKQLSE